MTAETAFSSLEPGQTVTFDVLSSVLLPQVGRHTDDVVSVRYEGSEELDYVRVPGGDRDMRAKEYSDMIADASDVCVSWLSGEDDSTVQHSVWLSRRDTELWVVDFAE